MSRPSRLLRRLREKPAPPVLRCAICLVWRTGLAEPADTVIGGTARCYDHLTTPLSRPS